MPDDTSDIIRIETDGVDVPEVMRRIDERIAARASAPEYAEESIEELERRGRGVERGDFFADPLQELTMAIQFARSYAEVSSDYPIGSSRKVIGPLIVLVKRVVRKLLKTYIDAVFEQQRDFNRQLLNIIENLDQLILRDRARSHPGKVDRLAFYERWDGGFDDSVERMREVAALFDRPEWVVDLGAGRGEFLKAALDQGLEAIGVEGDPALAASCQGRGLQVLCVDPLVYLEQVPLSSIPAFFSCELGERIALHELQYIVNQLADRMCKGARAVFLNHRPTSFYGSEAAFRDPTITRLVHPEALTFLLEKAGFSEVQSRPFALDPGKWEKESEAMRKALKKLEKDAPGVGAAWEGFLAPPWYLIDARR